MKVYQAICAITAELARSGIAKDRSNTQQGYKFRGIDDVYAALSPMLARHNLCILPRVVDRQVLERTNNKGTTLFYTTVRMEFDFVSAEDGSKHTVAMVGEAMDSGDKSSNKAQSAAYKYACFQTFCIPTEGDNDADATTHEVAARPAPRYSEQEAKIILDSLREAALEGPAALQERFKGIPAGAAKVAVWSEHAESLKAAAAQAKVPA